MKKKLISIIMAASLFTGILTGCGTGSTVNTDNNPSASKGESGPKGRYTEADIKFPDGLQVDDIIQTADGSLEMYALNPENTAGEGSVERYTYDKEKGEWEKEDKSFLEGIEFPFGYNMIYGEDNNRYVLFPSGEDYQFSMYKLSEDGTKQPVMEQALAEKSDRGFSVMPDFAAVLADGRVILSIRNASNVYAPTGELLYSLPQASSSSNTKTSGYVSGNELLTVGDNGFLLYDITGTTAGEGVEIPFQQEGADSNGTAVPDGNGGFYIANSQGIHHRSQGGSLWETVVDGSLNSLSLPSLYLRKMFMGGNEDFYIWLMSDGGNVVKHYTFNQDMLSVPSETLTVYGLDLSKSDTIKQAASMFQLRHPDVRVELINGKNTAGSTTVSDTIRALNTELLGGNGADILLLDGLPVSSYIEKGVLENMKDLLSNGSGDHELMGNVLSAFQQDNGDIFQFPARMLLLGAYGDAGAVNSLKSMADMKTYQSTFKLPMRPKATYEALLRQILLLQYNEIMDSATGKPTPGKIKELLETVEILGKANGAKTVFDESEDGGKGTIYNIATGSEGFTSNDYFEVNRDACSLALEKIGGLSGVMIPFSVIEKKALTLEGVNNSFLPKDLLGINSKSKNKELAKEFILFVLGKEVQENDLSDGLPINVPAWDKLLESGESKEGYSLAVSSDNGESMLSAQWPSKENIERILELATQADRPILMDNVLLEIVIDETKGYFEGSLSLEQAAQNAENKANLYFSEK